MRRPYRSRRQVQSVREPFRDPEISNLDHLLRSEKYVLRLEVAVEDVLLVDVLEGKGDLDEPAEDVRFWEILVRLSLPLHHHAQVASIRVFHDDQDSFGFQALTHMICSIIPVMARLSTIAKFGFTPHYIDMVAAGQNIDLKI